MAPEQISGRPVDARCDIYSLACVVHEMLTGTPPFRRDNDMAMLWAHQNDPPPDLSPQRPDLTPAADAVMARALAKSPGDRFGTCRRFVAELRAAAESPAPAPGPEVTHPATRVDTRPAGQWQGLDVSRPGAVRPQVPPEPPEWAAPVFPLD